MHLAAAAISASSASMQHAQRAYHIAQQVKQAAGTAARPAGTAALPHQLANQGRQVGRHRVHLVCMVGGWVGGWVVVVVVVVVVGWGVGGGGGGGSSAAGRVSRAARRNFQQGRSQNTCAPYNQLVVEQCTQTHKQALQTSQTPSPDR